LLAGRVFALSDSKDAPAVVIVNEAFARRFFDERNALGQHISFDRTPDEKQSILQIVGIVGNSRHESLAIEPIPEVYVPFAQEPERRVNIVLRTSTGQQRGLETAVRNAIHELDHDVYVPELELLESLIGTTLAQPRFNTMLLGTFAGVAIMLAAIGIYGVMAYSVAQRTREIGIRMALGAQRLDMLRMILRQSMIVAGVGLISGLAASLAATRLMATLLYGVSANDVTTYAVVMVLLGGATLLASYLPARRAMNVNPIVALRYE
jgi:putative ABC transport system permease protein